MQNLIPFSKSFHPVSDSRYQHAAAIECGNNVAIMQQLKGRKKLVKLIIQAKKNFSTAALFLTLATAAVSGSAFAKAPKCTFLANAPDQHRVVRGDTLWDVSGKFLQHPWCWPQVWDMNREQIKNPHWIYPGQIVYFDRVNGRLGLGKPGANGGMPTVQLSPRVRSSDSGNDAIATVSLDDIKPFLSKPLIIEENELQNAPRIVATQEGRVYLAQGDKAYVRGDLQGHTSFDVFRPGKALKDPATEKILGYEAIYLGAMKLQQQSKSVREPDTMVLLDVKQEMGVGDRLVAQHPTPFINFVPHAPEQLVAAQIMSIYGGVTNAGQGQIVSINHGTKNGIDVGTVLELYRLGRLTIDPTAAGDDKTIKLPDEKYGTLLVFRVFKNISYGLIMQVQDAVQVGDIAKSPE